MHWIDAIVLSQSSRFALIARHLNVIIIPNVVDI